MSIISIIMPVYNVESYVHIAIDSVLQQTYTDFTLICINDGSTDTSLSILQEYARQDSRIIVIDQENKGAGAARNTGLDNVVTPYVTFVDADDSIHPQYLEILLYAIQKYDVDFVWCKDKKFHEDSEIKEKKAIHYQQYDMQCFVSIFKHFVLRLPPHPSVMMNKLYKTTLLNTIRFNELLRHVEDILFAHYMLYKATNAVFVDLQLYYYRQHGLSVSNVDFSARYIEDHITVGEELARYFGTVSMDEETERHFWFRTSKMMLKNPLVHPWRKKRREAEHYWKIYAQRLKQLYKENLFRPEYLDIRNKILAYALLTDKYWLIRCILKLSYW